MEEYKIRTRCAHNRYGVCRSIRSVSSVLMSGPANQRDLIDQINQPLSALRVRGCIMGRVFIVDDDESVRQTVGFVLKQAGYEVLEAADGEEAIAMIESYPTGFSVQAIICDIHLPKVNGYDLIAFIRAKLPSVPIIVMTGYPEVQGAASLFKQGVVDYLAKPGRADTLLDAVRRAIDEQAVFG